MYRVLKLLKKIVLCGSIFVMSIVFSLHFEMSVHAEEESPRYEIRVNRAANCVTVYEKDENGMMAKMGASMGIRKEVKSDNSDTSIAEMLIQGVSMGSLEMEKKIKNYKDVVDKKDLKFAEDFLEFQQDVITGLKKYL